MKNRGLLSLSLWCSILLAGCNCGYDYNCPATSQYTGLWLSEAMQYCLDNWWVHSLINSTDEVYWECALPHGLICNDQEFLAWNCYEERADLTNVDTEEKRVIACKNQIMQFLQDIEEVYEADISLEDTEVEEDEKLIRKGTVTYEKDGSQKEDFTCTIDMFDAGVMVEIW